MEVSSKTTRVLDTWASDDREAVMWHHGRFRRRTQLIRLDDALSVFAQIAPRQAKVVELCYFGLNEEEIVESSKSRPRTVLRDW